MSQKTQEVIILEIGIAIRYYNTLLLHRSQYNKEILNWCDLYGYKTGYPQS